MAQGWGTAEVDKWGLTVVEEHHALIVLLCHVPGPCSIFFIFLFITYCGHIYHILLHATLQHSVWFSSSGSKCFPESRSGQLEATRCRGHSKILTKQLVLLRFLVGLVS